MVVIVLAKILFQFRAYCNNILYTGGMINKSAKLDILCAIVYIAILLAIIKPTQIYAIPIATLIVSLLFIVWYLKLMRDNLSLDVRMLATEIVKSVLLILPFLVVHFILQLDYRNLYLYAGYFVVFSVAYFVVLYYINRTFFTSLLSKFHKR